MVNYTAISIKYVTNFLEFDAKYDSTLGRLKYKAINAVIVKKSGFVFLTPPTIYACVGASQDRRGDNLTGNGPKANYIIGNH